MNPWEKKYDWQGETLTEAYDELPLWSAVPGQLLLDELPLQGLECVVDLGCGTGFPLLLLARRLGPAAHLIGVDPWEAALARARRKCAAWGLQNVSLRAASAAHTGLPSASVDGIVSNMGLLNFDDLPAVLAECRRLLRPQGRICLTTNLAGTFREAYAAWEAVTEGNLRARFAAHAAHRRSLAEWQAYLAEHGFVSRRTVEAEFAMRYASGTAFLEDYFIGMGFLPGWTALMTAAEAAVTYPKWQAALNAVAAQEGALRLTVPIAYLELELAGS